MQVEEAKAGFFHTSKGRRAALAVAAGIGPYQLMGKVIMQLGRFECSAQSQPMFTTSMLTRRERELSAVGIRVRSSRAGQGKLADQAGLSECSRQQRPNTAHGILLQWVWAPHSPAAAVLPIYASNRCCPTWTCKQLVPLTKHLQRPDPMHSWTTSQCVAPCSCTQQSTCSCGVWLETCLPTLLACPHCIISLAKICEIGVMLCQGTYVV